MWWGLTRFQVLGVSLCSICMSSGLSIQSCTAKYVSSIYSCHLAVVLPAYVLRPFAPTSSPEKKSKYFTVLN